MKKIELAMLIGMIISVFSAGFCGFAEDYDGITDKLFRLHILANSDSEADQSLKLKVRDAVLENCSYLFENCENAEQSAAVANENMDEIQMVAEQTLSENGSDYSVNCEVTEMYFDERVYGAATVPAGEYSAMRITIGEAKGKNWWCVMFPPLCIPVAAETAEELSEYSDVFTVEEIKMLSNPESYECRFYILELIEKIKNCVEKENTENL